MTSEPRTHTASAAPSFLTGLVAGRLPLEMLRAFPEQDPDDARAGEKVAAELHGLLAERLDPGELDRTGELPAGLLGELGARGYFALRNDPELGGLGLSDHAAFRVVERAAQWSVALAQIVAIQNAVGVAALLPTLPPGEGRQLVLRHIREATLSGFASSEPSGQNNAWPGTTAEPTADGSAYVLNGEKLFIGNATVAGVLAVAATLRVDGERRLGVFLVDTADPGFQVTARLSFMGSHGLPNGGFRLNGVRVPREHALTGGPGGGRLPTSVMAVALLSAVYFNGAPALGIARECERGLREFVARRSIDGRALMEYEAVRRRVEATRAEIFAAESVARWTLLTADPATRVFELLLAKNICAATGWEIADRTVGLLGGEGLETADSKRRRGAVPFPAERLQRDARGLRISGNVDFLVDIQAGQFLLSAFARNAGTAAAPAAGSREAPDAGLTPVNAGHLRAADEDIRRLARSCAELVRRHPDQAELIAREETLRLLGRISAELLTMCAVLGRARRGPDSQDLADAVCSAVRVRLLGLWAHLAGETEPGTAPDPQR